MNRQKKCQIYNQWCLKCGDHESNTLISKSRDLSKQSKVKIKWNPTQMSSAFTVALLNLQINGKANRKFVDVITSHLFINSLISTNGQKNAKHSTVLCWTSKHQNHCEVPFLEGAQWDFRCSFRAGIVGSSRRHTWQRRGSFSNSLAPSLTMTLPFVSSIWMTSVDKHWENNMNTVALQASYS